MAERKFTWRHALVYYAGVQAAQVAFRFCARKYLSHNRGLSREPDREQYEKQHLPVFAPPGWIFPVAWGINSASLLAGGIRTLNLPSETPGRRQFLATQAAAWTLYSAFSAAYFDLQSPINAAAITLAYTAFIGSSLHAATQKMGDCKAALSLATTVAWLAIANPVGLTQAAWNYDKFWNTSPLIQPNERWIKKSE